VADLRQQFYREVERLRTIAGRGDPRVSALLTAVTDDRVTRPLLDLASEGHFYSGALVTSHGGTTNVIFSFRRPEGSFGILPLSLLARVSVDDGRVLDVVENFLAPEREPSPPIGQLQPDIDIQGAAFASFDEDEVSLEEAEADAAPPPKVAPPPKKSLWI
jgi:hypothetical protein